MIWKYTYKIMNDNDRYDMIENASIAMFPIELPAFVCHDAVQRAGGLAAHLAFNLGSEAEMDQWTVTRNHLKHLEEWGLHYVGGQNSLYCVSCVLRVIRWCGPLCQCFASGQLKSKVHNNLVIFKVAQWRRISQNSQGWT